jgi:glc operon protein GlcG
MAAAITAGCVVRGLAITLASVIGVHPCLGAAQLPPAHRLTLADALMLIDAAQREAGSKNYRMSFAVVDGRGDVIAVARMPEAGSDTPDSATGKAMLSAIFGRSSGSLARISASPLGQGLYEASGGRLRFAQGALPIVRDGFTIGAIGAAGGTEQQDEDMVRVALAATR